MSRDTVNELTSEDHLRLSVLMAQARAIRIDEATMRVAGRVEGGERYVQLHPGCPDYRYLQSVRHLLAEIVLGQPWGFPTFIHRWTRSGSLGSVRDQQDLLKLGEPEAVKALAASEELAPELYELVWWSQPTAEIARLLLAHSESLAPGLGRELALFLVEHLPFETDAMDEMETVREVLAPGLLSEKTIKSLWSRREEKPQYRVGFLLAAEDRLLDSEPPHPLLGQSAKELCHHCRNGNQVAKALHRLLDSRGQTYLREVFQAMKTPGDQEVFSNLVNGLGSYVGLDMGAEHRELEALFAAAEGRVQKAREVGDLVEINPQFQPMILALFVLAGVSEQLFYSLFSRTSATGSLLRRKLGPFTGPLMEQIRVLCPQASSE